MKIYTEKKGKYRSELHLIIQTIVILSTKEKMYDNRAHFLESNI